MTKFYVHEKEINKIVHDVGRGQKRKKKSIIPGEGRARKREILYKSELNSVLSTINF